LKNKRTNAQPKPPTAEELVGENDSGLLRLEWHFDNVPDSELATCRLWEYARESDSIRQICQRTVSVANNSSVPKEERDTVRHEFYRLFNGLGRAAILFQAGVYGFGGTKHHPGFKSPFPRPWQTLSTEEKAILLETVEWEVRDISPIPGFRRSQMPMVKALAESFQPKKMREVFGGEGKVDLVKYFHSGNKLRSICPCFMYPDGTEVLVVEIAWGEFTNEQLTKEFARWLTENQPEGINRPDQRGRKLKDVRVALDRLGIMRLLHRFTLAEMPRRCPEAWRAFDGFDWYKERKRAGAMFGKLFPFLSRDDHPRSWPTKGGKRHGI
jgi:hypothetical protein